MPSLAAVEPRPLRRWQQEALDGYTAAGEPQDFLVAATPGAGKTSFALTLARGLLEDRTVERLVVVAPTEHLKNQWAEAAAAFGIFLDPSLTNAVGPVGPDYHGYVTTYAGVAAHPRLHASRTTAKKTLVVLDEVHHAGDGATWGDAVATAFEDARRRLALSGTPFRTRKGERIPFVRYADDVDEDGEPAVRSVADHSYGYREALADGVVRPVVFGAYSGVTRFRTSAGAVVAATLGEVASRDLEQKAWRTALDPGGQWIPHVLAAADARLADTRRTVPDAAGMVLAGDQDTAREYAKILRRITGTAPVVVLSDDPRASARIEDFHGSADRWVVAVRMISEGVDVPRLSVLVLATTASTPLFFAQAVGRVLRRRRAGETATVFLPAVRKLLVLAADLETERDHVVRQRKDAPDGLDEPATSSADEPGAPTWEALEAEATFAHLIHGGAAHTGDGAVPDPDGADADFLGLPGLLDASQTAALLRSRDDQARQAAARARRAGADETDLHQEDPDEERTDQEVAALRKEINALVGRTARRTGRPHAAVHAQLRRAVPGPPSATASLKVLRARRDHLSDGR